MSDFGRWRATIRLPQRWSGYHNVEEFVAQPWLGLGGRA